MNPIDRNKIWKMVGILALITVVAGGLLRVSQHNSYTLGDYAMDNPSLAYQTAEPSPTPEPTPVVDNSNENATENFHGGNYCFDRLFPERRAIDRPADHAVRRLLL